MSQKLVGELVRSELDRRVEEAERLFYVAQRLRLEVARSVQRELKLGELSYWVAGTVVWALQPHNGTERLLIWDLEQDRVNRGSEGGLLPLWAIETDGTWNDGQLPNEILEMLGLPATTETCAGVYRMGRSDT